VRSATVSTKQLALNDVYGRLKLRLESLAEPPAPDGSRLLREHLTHLELARDVGCTREMAGRLMRALEEGSYIERTRLQTRLLRPLPPRY